MAKKKFGGRQRESRKSKMEMLVGKPVTASFFSEEGKRIEVILNDEIEKRGGYFLKNYNLQLPLKDIRFKGYGGNLKVIVSEGGYIETQLKALGKLG